MTSIFSSTGGLVIFTAGAGDGASATESARLVEPDYIILYGSSLFVSSDLLPFFLQTSKMITITTISKTTAAIIMIIIRLIPELSCSILPVSVFTVVKVVPVYSF